MKYQVKRIFSAITVQLLLVWSMYASHNTSRFFQFLERSQEYSSGRNSYINPGFFYTTASTSLLSDGRTAGIPELWGNYDLKEVISSLGAVHTSTGAVFVNPIETITGTNELVDKALKFKVSSKVRSNGFILHYEQKILKGFSIGGWVPVIFVTSTGKYHFDIFNKDNDINFSNLTLNKQIVLENQVDRIRRLTHELAGFHSNRWSKSGFGDLDLYIKWNWHDDYRWLIKGIDLNFQAGVVAPTGILSNHNNPFSVSVMGNGHWSFYFDFAPEFELKQDWKFGFIVSCMHQLKNSRTLRLSVENEPTIFSSLIAKVQIDPGFTFKVSPFISIENLTDGLHFQGRYTYLKHGHDKWKDLRKDAVVQSYLSKDNKVISYKKKLSKWNAHYFTFQVSYDSKVALKHYWLDPLFYLTYDMPINGNKISQTHQLTFGVKMHF